MKKKNWFFLFVFISGCLVACDKNNFDAQGGELPTHYVTFRDTVFNPAQLVLANGSSITFLNQTDNPISITGDDTTLLKLVMIDAHSSYFFKPDTIPASPVNIFIPYHCVEYTSARGSITLTP